MWNECPQGASKRAFAPQNGRSIQQIVGSKADLFATEGVEPAREVTAGNFQAVHSNPPASRSVDASPTTMAPCSSGRGWNRGFCAGTSRSNPRMPADARNVPMRKLRNIGFTDWGCGPGGVGWWLRGGIAAKGVRKGGLRRRLTRGQHTCLGAPPGRAHDFVRKCGGVCHSLQAGLVVRATYTYPAWNYVTCPELLAWFRCIDTRALKGERTFAHPCPKNRCRRPPGPFWTFCKAMTP